MIIENINDCVPHPLRLRFSGSGMIVVLVKRKKSRMLIVVGILAMDDPI